MSKGLKKFLTKEVVEAKEKEQLVVTDPKLGEFACEVERADLELGRQSREWCEGWMYAARAGIDATCAEPHLLHRHFGCSRCCYAYAPGVLWQWRYLVPLRPRTSGTRANPKALLLG